MKNTRRNFQLDLLRVLACYLVIHQHASEFFYIGEGGSAVKGESTFLIGLITSLARISVPLFVMISGYLLLPMKSTTSEFFKKRFTRILYPFVVWCILYALYYMAYRGDTLTQALINIAHIPVNFGVEVGHLWYIYMLIGLYLMIPVISPWLSSCSKKEMQTYLALWLLTTLLPYIHIVYPNVLGECFWNPTPAFYYFNGFIGYLTLGAYIKKYGALSTPYAVAISVVGYAITAGIFCSRIETSSLASELELSWGFCTTNVAMLTYGVFSMIMNLSAEGNGKWGSCIRDISIHSYGIYLAHIMVLNILYRYLNPLFDTVLLSVPVISAATFICVYAVVKLLSKAPYSKYWLG